MNTKIFILGEVEAGAGKFVETPGTPKAGGGTQTGKGTDTKSFGVKAQSTDLPGRSVFLRNGDKGDEDGDDRRNRRRPLPVPPHYTDYNDTDLELVFLYLERIMKFFDDLNDGLQLPNINGKQSNLPPKQAFDLLGLDCWSSQLTYPPKKQLLGANQPIPIPKKMY